MHFKSTSLIITLLFLFSACEKSSNKETAVTTVEAETSTAETASSPRAPKMGSSDLKSTDEVKEYLSNAGFMISVKGKEIIREDQLTGADPDDLAAGIAVLAQNPEENKLTIFYMKVAGSALDSEKSSTAFIDQVILSDPQYLDHVDRMVKFLQRQDRPTIKKALITTIDQMSEDQCIEYLQKIGYVTGSDYEPKALNSIPLFVRIAIVDRLRKATGDGVPVCNQLKKDMKIDA